MKHHSINYHSCLLGVEFLDGHFLTSLTHININNKDYSQKWIFSSPMCNMEESSLTRCNCVFNAIYIIHLWSKTVSIWSLEPFFFSYKWNIMTFVKATSAVFLLKILQGFCHSYRPVINVPSFLGTSCIMKTFQARSWSKANAVLWK